MMYDLRSVGLLRVIRGATRGSSRMMGAVTVPSESVMLIAGAAVAVMPSDGG